MRWYENRRLLTHIELYKDERAANTEAQRALSCGWAIQGTAATTTHIGGSAMAAMPALGWLMWGNKRKTNMITLTYVRPVGWKP